MKSQITKKVPLISTLTITVINLLIAHFMGDLKLINNAVADPLIQSCAENIKAVGKITAAFSPDGSLLAAIESTGAITVREVASGQVVWDQIDESNPKVTELTFADNGKLLASLGNNGIGLWNALSGKQLGTIATQNAQSKIVELIISPDGIHLAGLNAQNTINVWAFNSDAAKLIQTESGAHVSKIAFSPDGNFISGVYEVEKSAKIKLWNTNTGEFHAEFVGSPSVTSSLFSPDNRVMATAGQDGLIHLWNPKTGKRTQILAAEDPVSSLAFSPDGNYLASASNGEIPKIQVWNLATGELTTNHTFVENVTTTDLLFSPDGTLLASVGDDNRINLWSIPNGELKQQLIGQTEFINKISFNSQQSLVASLAIDGQLIVWDMLTGVQKFNTFLLLQTNSGLAETQATFSVNSKGCIKM